MSYQSAGEYRSIESGKFGEHRGVLGVREVQASKRWYESMGGIGSDGSAMSKESGWRRIALEVWRVQSATSLGSVSECGGI